MAGTGGHFLKGLSSGIQSGLNMGHEIQEMQWKKAERQRLADAQEKAAEELTNYQSKLKIFSEDGFSEDEYSQLSTLFKTGGLLFQSQVEATHKAIESGHREESQQNIEWMETYAEEIGDSDPKLWKSLFEETRNKLTPENRHYFDAYDRSKQKKFDKAQPQPQAETFRNYTEAAKAYPDANIKYNAAKGVYYPEGEKVDPDKEKTYEYQAKVKDIDKAVASGLFTFEEGKQAKLRLYGGSANIPAGGKTMGIDLVEETRGKMAKVKTWKEAKDILEDAKGAGWSTDQVKVAEKQWTQDSIKTRKTSVENTKKTLDDMVGDNTWRGEEEYQMMYGGKLTTKTKAEWYKILYAQYGKQLESLGALYNVDMYNIPTSPEKLKTVGWQLKAARSDILKSDLESIWE